MNRSATITVRLRRSQTVESARKTARDRLAVRPDHGQFIESGVCQKRNAVVFTFRKSPETR